MTHEGNAAAGPDRERLVAALLGRDASLLAPDIESHRAEIASRIEGRRVLVTGAAGSIGAATVHQVARYRPARLVALDISENNLVELVRDLRSRSDLDLGDALETCVVDFGSPLFDAYIAHNEPFDLVLHFAAMKHVRSERDVFSLARLVDTNVLAVDRMLHAVKQRGPCEVFAISSDKACRPANFMGATKRLMEAVVRWHARHPGALLREGGGAPLRRAALTRFANVAFSDGSLLHGFLRRMEKRQPLVGPSDVRRYFISETEAGQLCMLAAAAAGNEEILVPRHSAIPQARRFDELAADLLEACGYAPVWHDDLAAAMRAAPDDLAAGRYPCCFTPSETAGEKSIEEFVGPDERVDDTRFAGLDVVVESPAPAPEALAAALRELEAETSRPAPETAHARVGDILRRVVPSFQHVARDRNLDQTA